MITIDEAKKILQQHKLILRERFRVESIGVFGSFTRGEQKEGSDLDLLVEFSHPVGFFTFLELEEYLVNKLGVGVDLVTKNALKPGIGAVILREVQPI